MTALTHPKMIMSDKGDRFRFRLGQGLTAYQGGLAAIDLLTGEVCPAKVDDGLRVIGLFTETVTSPASATAPVEVRLPQEVRIDYFDNAGDVDAEHIGATAYAEDDQTVTVDDDGRSPVGVILRLDDRGVGVAVGLFLNTPIPAPAGGGD